MWGDMSLCIKQGPLLHSGDHIVPRILTVDHTFNNEIHLPQYNICPIATTSCNRRLVASTPESSHQHIEYRARSDRYFSSFHTALNILV